MRDIQNQFYIFSASLSVLDAIENQRRTSEVISLLDGAGVKYRLVAGCYDNTEEISFVVGAKWDDMVHYLAREYNQESVLFVDVCNNATLIYNDQGKIQRLGKFQRTEDVTGCNAYTMDLKTGNKFICA